MEKFFWMMYDHFKSQDETFIKTKHKGKLSRFKLRNIYAIDSTTIKLAYWYIKWAKHRQRKAAAKVHMVANVASRLPHFCVYVKDLMQSLWFYGIAPPPENVVLLANAPYLPGFEKMSAKSMG